MPQSPPGQGISGAGIAAIFAGGILAYSGVRGFSISQTAQQVIAGKNPSSQTPAAPVTAGGLIGGLFGGLFGGSSGSSTKVSPSGGSISPGNSAQNKALGQRMAASVGWTGSQWVALNNIVMSESGWSDTITNPNSSAAGIAQRIQGFGPGYQSGNAPQQIAWLIRYIKSRYGSPVNAWNFHLAHGWY